MDAPPETLLLMPGLDGTDIFLEPLLRALEKALPSTVQVRVWTLPAQGPQDYAGLLSALRDELSARPARWLLGWSFTGPLALMLAAEQPDLVRGVILAASFVRPPRPALRWLGPWVGPLGFLAWRLLRRLPIWWSRPPADAWRQAKDRTWREVSPGLLAARLREVARVDARGPLRDLAAAGVPLMYVASADDGVVPPQALKEIRILQPDVEVLTIPGQHQSLFSHAHEAVGPIVRFVTRGA